MPSTLETARRASRENPRSSWLSPLGTDSACKFADRVRMAQEQAVVLVEALGSIEQAKVRALLNAEIDLPDHEDYWLMASEFLSRSAEA